MSNLPKMKNQGYKGQFVPQTQELTQHQKQCYDDKCCDQRWRSQKTNLKEQGKMPKRQSSSSSSSEGSPRRKAEREKRREAKKLQQGQFKGGNIGDKNIGKGGNFGKPDIGKGGNFGQKM